MGTLARASGNDRHATCLGEMRAEVQMLDLVLIVVTVTFFLVAVLYVHGCNRV
jgi:hypothetical protein